jgi:hypothetical protein
MKLEIADIATNEKKRLQGFKVLGVFPFYLKYITTKTHVKLCKIKAQIKAVSKDDIKVSDFYNYKLQEAVLPLINLYVLTALVNDRPFSWFYKKLLSKKLNTCGHYHLLNLYVTIHKLDDPAFFLGYWTLITQEDNTLLREVKPS